MVSSANEKGIKLPVSGCKGQLADFESELAVIVTHPWGPLGGNMNNNVVLGVVFWFQKLQITTLRFDFCGSQIGRGYRQVDQVKEAADFLLKGRHHKNYDKNPEHEQQQHDNKNHHKHSKKASSASTTSSLSFSTTETPHSSTTRIPKHILLVGYSYGSIISASAAASIPPVIGVASIAPPLAVRHWLFMFHGNYHLEQMRKRPSLPQLMVIGDSDNFTSESAFMEIVKTMPQDTTTGAVLKGADHFFRGREKDLMDILGHWILDVFPQCNGDLKALRTAEFPRCESLDEQMEDNDPGCHACMQLDG